MSGASVWRAASHQVWHPPEWSWVVSVKVTHHMADCRASLKAHLLVRRSSPRGRPAALIESSVVLQSGVDIILWLDTSDAIGQSITVRSSAHCEATRQEGVKNENDTCLLFTHYNINMWNGRHQFTQINKDVIISSGSSVLNERAANARCSAPPPRSITCVLWSQHRTVKHGCCVCAC